MAVSIQFKTTGDAFADPCGALEECARILRNVSQRISNGDDGGRILDINGNTIGEWSADIDAQEGDA